MPTVQVPAQLTVEHLMAAVKQLSPGELRAFMQQVAVWQQQHSQRAEEEAALLARIAENTRLPAAAQRRFNHLRRKRQSTSLSNPEAAELKTLWQQVEQMNVARLEALTALAQRRDTDVQTLRRELGLAERPDLL